MSSNQNGNDHNTGGISPLEMESLNPSEDKKGNTAAPTSGRTSSFLPDHPLDKLMLLIKLYFELYPRLMFSGCLVVFILLIKWWSPWTSWYNAKYSQRNYMTRDYSALENDFNFKAAQIDHWCLFGGDDRCYCEDPMEGVPRTQVPGWTEAHTRNKHLADVAVGSTGGDLDVVFLGDQTVQSWDGLWLLKPAPEGPKIARYWNDTFHGKDTLQGLALGIYGDRLSNILWRIQHGEMPPALNPKVFWLIMGTNDLALGMCSEEVVTLGIMRIAEEVHHHYPDSIVVIQGILPRSNHKDGSLDGDSKYSTGPTTKDSWYNKKSQGYERDPILPPRQRQLQREALEGMLEEQMERELQATTTSTTPISYTGASTRAPESGGGSPSIGQQAMSSTSSSTTPQYGVTKTSSSSASTIREWMDRNNYHETLAPQPKYDYYLWPSIRRINKELEDFCRKHEHLVYFDSDELLLGSVGNAHYRAKHKSIVKDLMPNYVHLSALGHKVVMDAINDELQRIIFDDDEKNDIETQKGSLRKSDPDDDSS